MNSLKILLLTSAITTSIPVVALAEEGGATAVGEVLVTARKREESLLNVPVIASVQPRQQLIALQAVDVREIAKLVPNLWFADGSAGIGTQVSLRGVGTSAVSPHIDASVSLNVDGLQITQALSYAGAMFDIDRVEVLKGPQALFYGKNSPGGVIALRTADPTDKFEVIASAGYEFEAHERRAELIVSGPVSDTLKLRLASAYDKQDGFFRNVATAAPGLGGVVPSRKRNPNDENYIARATALWNPTAAFNAKLKLNVLHDYITGNDPRQYLTCPEGVGPVPGIGIPFLGGAEDCKLNRNIVDLDADPKAFPGYPTDGRMYRELDHQYGTLELNYHPAPDLTLTSVTGYYHMKFKGLSNGTSTTYAGPSLLLLSEPVARRDYTQELRLQSDYSGPLNFMGGVYYQNAKINNFVALSINQALPIRLPPLLQRFQQLIGIKSFSAYGQLRWKATPQLELAGGARWTDERRHLTAYIWNSGSPVLFPTARPKIASKHISPEFTATYKPNSDVTLFAAYKVSYKSGSFDATTLTGTLPDYSFGDEKAYGGEAGIKARLFDHRATASLAAYNYKYKGMQVGSADPVVSGVPIFRTLNAGAARTYGVEFDGTYSPPHVEGLTLRASVAYTHARFLRLDGAPCWGGQTISEGCNERLNPGTGLYTAQNLDGLSMLRAPTWSSTFGFTYTMPVSDDFNLVITNSNQTTTEYLATLGRRSDFTLPGFIKTDLSLTLQGPRDRWEVALIGKNLGNKVTGTYCSSYNAANGQLFGGEITGGTGRGPAGIDEFACFGSRGREIWIRATVRPFN
jgi:iron complex outermembrane receptor protein